MSEEEIRTILEAKLKDKLGESWGPKFTFVRAVGNKIIAPQLSESECYDGKMIKRFSGQGPVYIRANKDISSLLFSGKEMLLRAAVMRMMTMHLHVAHQFKHNNLPQVATLLQHQMQHSHPLQMQAHVR